MDGRSREESPELVARALERLDGRELLPVSWSAFRKQKRPWSSFDMPEEQSEMHAATVALLRARLEQDPAEAWTSVDPALRDVAMWYARVLIRQEDLLADFRAAREDPASLHSRLPDGDRARIEAVLLVQGRGRADRTVEDWRETVERIAGRGDRWCVEDLEGALRPRDELDRLFSVLTPAGQQVLRDLVDPLDEAFVAATVELPGILPEIVGPERPAPAPWWWHRVPRDQSETLRRQLDGRATTDAMGRPIPAPRVIPPRDPGPWMRGWYSEGRAQMRVLLWERWDPLGLRSLDDPPEDAYDDYDGMLASNIKRGSDLEDVTAYLTTTLTEEDAVTPAWIAQCRRTAQDLLDWYRASNAPPPRNAD